MISLKMEVYKLYIFSIMLIGSGYYNIYFILAQRTMVATGHKNPLLFNQVVTNDLQRVGTCWDENSARKQIFLPLCKGEFCAAKGYTGSLTALKGRSYIYAFPQIFF